MKTVLFAVLALSVAVACHGCQPPNCDHVDFGTCGNACCNLTLVAGVSTATATQVLNKTLWGMSSEGYQLAPLAEGGVGFTSFANYNMLPANALGQAYHYTKVHRYRDTLNFLLTPLTPANTSTIATAFSISEIGGAYGDAGQNFKNLITPMLASGISWSYTITAGCPAPSNAEPTPGLTYYPTMDALMAATMKPAAAATPEPLDLHASCRLTWTFDSNSCASASASLAQAARSLTGFSQCGHSEKCGYTLKAANASYLQATHTTPVHHYVDDISIHFNANGAGCTAHAYSTSTIWYAVLDDGTNYCNLHNLVEASGLAFSEDIDKSDCTQYSSANCNKY